MQEQTKENKLPVVLLPVIIVVLLVGSIVIGIFGGGGKKVETAVSKKDIKAAREAAELSDEGEVQTIAIDNDIIVNAGGTGSAGFTDNRGFPDSTEHGRLHFPE